MTQAPTVVEPDAGPAAPKMSGLAVASLVCGILGPCTVGLAGIVGIILGAVSLRRINRSAGALRGSGVAIAGIIVSVVGLLLALMVAAIAIPALVLGMREARATACRNDLSMLCKGVELYSSMYEDKYPPVDGWQETLLKEGFVSAGLFHDRTDPDAAPWFAMNRHLEGLRLSEIARPSETVLLFECRFGSPAAGDRANLPDAPPHPGGYLIGFCDGHVETVPAERLGDLVWEPAAGGPGREEPPPPPEEEP